jgi:branched-chain amino acid transport system substrate-binding protein
MNLKMIKSKRMSRLFLLLGTVFCLSAGQAPAEERIVKIAGIGAKTGVLKPFGDNSEAAIRAAADQINGSGGIKLGDGATGRIVVEYIDDRCNAQDGIAAVRQIASSDWLAAIGTTCSSVLEPVYGVLQKKVTDPGDSGVRLPIFGDVAMKIGLTKVSDWAFRNIPNEIKMYDTLWAWVKETRPELKTVYGGVEENFVHSKQTWYDVMKARAKLAGYDVKSESKWLVDDTHFVTQVAEMKKSGADIVAISAHPFTACGVLAEMARQGVKPKLLVGLTSVTSPETLEICGKDAEGLIVPTSFAAINPTAKAAAEATSSHHGYPDLHSMAAWENVFAIKRAVESQGVLARADTVQEDRQKIREGLATQKEIDGLMGPVYRTPDRESVKPFVLVKATNNKWQVIYTPPAE